MPVFVGCPFSLISSRVGSSKRRFKSVQILRPRWYGLMPPGVGPHDLVVAHQELEVQLLRQLDRVQDLAVDPRGPALVHDLGLDLRDEVARFLVDDGEEVALPVREVGIVVANEEQAGRARARERHFLQIRARRSRAGGGRS